MIFLTIDWHLPIKDNVLAFSIVLFIILLSPIILKRFKIPSIIGLMLAGMCIGGHGLNLITREGSISLFATIGLMYIMFLAGLEVDLLSFKEKKSRSISFGLLTFSIPFIIGFFVVYYFLNALLPPEHQLKWSGAILLSSMFSTNTLVAYPIIVRLGITKSEPVTITIGGTIITDTLVLLVFAVLSNLVTGTLDAVFILRLILSLTLFTIAVFVGIPILSRWFFRNIEDERGSQYIFVLAVVFLSGFLAEIAGVEPIIGAFMAGLALNRLIPQASPLMSRIEFVGQSLFIPFFLLSVGMVVDWRVFIEEKNVILFSLGLIIIALLTKWLAAWLTQVIFGYSPLERKLIFGLSSAHAAATIAIILAGFNLKILPSEALDATLPVIMISCLVSSIVTEASGRKYAVLSLEKHTPATEVKERIMVPIANPDHIHNLIDLALFIKDPETDSPIYPLSVIMDEGKIHEKIQQTYKMLEKSVSHVAETKQRIQPITKVDMNVADGIFRAIQENRINTVLMGWSSSGGASELLFGTVFDAVLNKVHQMIIVSKVLFPLQTFRSVHVAVPGYAELEIGFQKWIELLYRMHRQTEIGITFYGQQNTLRYLNHYIQTRKWKMVPNFHEMKNCSEFLEVSARLTGDLYVVISSRNFGVSYNEDYQYLPNSLIKQNAYLGTIVIYPQQNDLAQEDSSLFQIDNMTLPQIQNFTKIRSWRLWIGRLMDKFKKI